MMMVMHHRNASSWNPTFRSDPLITSKDFPDDDGEDVRPLFLFHQVIIPIFHIIIIMVHRMRWEKLNRRLPFFQQLFCSFATSLRSHDSKQGTSSSYFWDLFTIHTPLLSICLSSSLSSDSFISRAPLLSSHHHSSFLGEKMLLTGAGNDGRSCQDLWTWFIEHFALSSSRITSQTKKEGGNSAWVKNCWSFPRPDSFHVNLQDKMACGVILLNFFSPSLYLNAILFFRCIRIVSPSPILFLSNLWSEYKRRAHPKVLLFSKRSSQTWESLFSLCSTKHGLGGVNMIFSLSDERRWFRNTLFPSLLLFPLVMWQSLSSDLLISPLYVTWVQNLCLNNF